jgi:ribonuclease III
MTYQALSESLGVEIEPQLLELALTHRSFSYENGRIPNNERLEFLGDAILGFLVTAYIHDHFTDLQEGELTKLKNAVVSATALAEAANKIELGKYLRLGKGEEQTGGREKPNLLADAFEAVLGAVYVSQGINLAKKMVDTLIIPMLSDPDSLRENADPKTTLQELLPNLPRYETSFEGPDHDRVFHSSVFIEEKEVANASGRSRKQAETNAAIAALEILNSRT